MLNSHKTALVVEGGAMRSVFSAGLLDGFLEKQFNPFEFYIGVSAGAGNLAAYLAGKPGKSLQIFLDYALRKEFISYQRFLRGGHLIDLDWLSKVTFSESLLDLQAIYHHGKPFYVCVTDVNTGSAHYIKTTITNLENAIKSSSALPLLYRGFPVMGDRPMTDGGVADSIPLAAAIRMGANRIMVVRSRPKPYLKKDTLGHKLIRWRLKKYPLLTATMRERVKRHKDTVSLIQNPPPGIEVVEICPPDNINLGRFARNRNLLMQYYRSGFELADVAIQQWRNRLTDR